jgi:hypothetical protein
MSFRGDTSKIIVGNKLIKEIIGKTVEEATKLCEEKEFQCRSKVVDGKGINGIMNAVGNRVNFVVEKGIVTEATIG